MSAITQTQRDQLLIELREGGHSLQEIADRLGRSISWAHGRTTQLVAAGVLNEPELVLGRNGRLYPPRHNLGMNRWPRKDHRG